MSTSEFFDPPTATPLSQLALLTADQYNQLQITRFAVPPSVQTDGSPDTSVGVQITGYVTGTNKLAFIVTNSVDVTCSVSLDSTTGQVDANIGTVGGPNPTTISYYTVDMGVSPTGAWMVSYATMNGGRPSGKWVYTKGKPTVDDF